MQQIKNFFYLRENQNSNYTSFQKRLILLFILVFILFFSLLPNVFAEVQDKPEIKAESAILVDISTGQILYQNNPHSKRPVASLTKIIAAIIILEENKTGDEVVASERAAEMGESEIYLYPGDKLSVEQLLYALLLKSANDAAIALAEFNSGSVEAFVRKMNLKAKDIGALDTAFKNPHGLPEEGHFSTANDIALFSRYALRNPLFAKIVATQNYILQMDDRDVFLENRNKLIGINPIIKGVKTGHTNSAGYCLVTSADKNKLSLLSVVLNSPNEEIMYKDAETILDYGFNNFQYNKIINKDQAYQQFKVPEYIDKYGFLVARNDLYLTTAGLNDPLVNLKVTKPKRLNLPIKKGQKLAEMEIYYRNKLIGRVDLITEKNYLKPSLWEKVKIKIFNFWRFIRSYL